MDKKQKKEAKDTARLLVYLAVAIFIIGIFAILPKIFSAQDMLFQTIAVVLSVVFTAVVTNQLLTGQSNSEESRERNIKVYENKISVYAEFVSKMWSIMNDGKVEPDEIIALRSDIFNKLIFYLDDSQIKAISEELEKLEFDSVTDAYVAVFENITKILRSNIMETEQDKSKTEIQTLWNRFNCIFKNDQEPELETQLPDKMDSESVPEPQVLDMVESDRLIHRNCVHFNMLDDNWQKSIFANDVNALGLCEYGEVWRTKMIQRSRNNDIVFLYQTGGPGYIGAFLAKGWVVFEADGNGNMEKEVRYEFDKQEGEVVVESEVDRNNDIDRFCARKLINDGCTRVSFLLVEPLIFCEEGVGVISVYRRTISTYDSHYAWLTLGRFKAMVDGWPEDLNKYHLNGEEKIFETNKDALQQIFSENNVKAADWNDEANKWIDK